MALTINGSSLTYPDGSIQVSSSKIVNVARVTYNTRTAWSTTTAAEIWNWSYTKLYSNSYLYVEVDLSMRNNYSDCLVWELNYAEGSYFQGTQPYDAGFSANSRPFYTTMWMDTLPNGVIGSKNMILEYYTANGNTGNRAAQVLNPNNRQDDNRYTQEYSSVTVFELAR